MLGTVRKFKVFNITITEVESATNEPRFSYYLGKRFVFGVNTPFTKTDLENLFLDGYFD